jgi:hypothetical protein
MIERIRNDFKSIVVFFFKTQELVILQGPPASGLFEE